MTPVQRIVRLATSAATRPRLAAYPAGRARRLTTVSGHAAWTCTTSAASGTRRSVHRAACPGSAGSPTVRNHSA
jgi:hypothetical protein